MNNNATQPAFPIVGEAPGLSKRELISAMAMQGVLASFSSEGNIGDPETTAKTALMYADALLTQLSKE